MKSEIVSREVAAATSQAQVFLLPPYDSATARRDSLMASSELVRQAIGPAVRAGRDDVALRLLQLAHSIEASQ